MPDQDNNNKVRKAMFAIWLLPLSDQNTIRALIVNRYSVLFFDKKDKITELDIHCYQKDSSFNVQIDLSSEWYR